MAATSLKQPAPLAPDSTKALESISVEQSPLYNGQLELAHRRLSQPGFTAHLLWSLMVVVWCTDLIRM